MEKEPLALFGGTFDPVHYGHLRCAEEARQKLHLETLFMLPAGEPPHRAAPARSVGQRLDMLRLALSEFPQLAIDERETRRPGPSYMVETLRDVRAESPRRSVILLLGQDAANQLHSWYHWRQLFELAHIVVLSRPGSWVELQGDVAAEITPRTVSDPQLLASSLAGRVLSLKVSAHDISATSIKEMIRREQMPEGMLPAAEFDYICEHALYQ